MSTFWYNVGIMTATALSVAGLATFIAKCVHPSQAKRLMPFFIVCFLLSLWASVKPVVISDAVGIKAETSEWDTNSWSCVVIRWRPSPGYPADVRLDIDAAIGGGAVTNWSRVSSPMAWDLSSTVFASDFVTPGNHLTNYIYRITSIYRPGVVTITDFLARASLTNRIVDVTFSAPTNVVGKLGAVEYRMMRPGEPWRHLTTCVGETNNHVRCVGNFVSRGTDREFRVRFDNTVITPVEDNR